VVSSSPPSISIDGRYVAYASQSNVVPDDYNSAPDVFVRDLVADTTTLVSRASDGAQGTAASGWPTLMGNGRYVLFWSASPNLVPNDTNGFEDVFRRRLDCTQALPPLSLGDDVPRAVPCALDDTAY
jgi:Tol biopolymer transport system component